MTGLDKILKAIEADAKSNKEAVIAQAKREAEDITAAALKEAKNQSAVIKAKSDLDVKAVLSRAESAAELAQKKSILDAKQQMINHIISAARNSLSSLSDSDYVNVILKMVKKHAHNQPGKIVFSSSDRKRLPVDFNIRLQSILNGNAALALSEDTAGIDGGFLLIYGDVEENCSFDALFAAEKEELQDIINSFLFTGVSQNIHPIGE
jgi:V/A-type H+-transporting ATPase subunit E